MKVVLRPAVTMDGYIADLEGECYSWVNPHDEARYMSALRRTRCELVGRHTYEQYMEMYNARDDIMTFVYTNDPKYLDTEHIKFVGGPIIKVLRRIDDEYSFPEITVSGGGELNGLLATEGVLDEIVMSVHPITLGEGIPLFGSYKPKLVLELIATNEDVPGVIQNRYRVMRNLTRRKIL